MTKRYIQVDGKRYLIRGPWTAKDLRRLYQSFSAKYPNTPFKEWLNRGFVYYRTRG